MGQDWLKDAKDLFIGCFYMPHRNANDLTHLQKSLEKLNTVRQKHVIICGDFNCPDIDWNTCCINKNADNREIQQQLLDIASDHCLTQVVHEPTRQNNILDLCFTSNSTLINNVQVIPGFSDHDIVIMDSIIRPEFHQPKKKKSFQIQQS